MDARPILVTGCAGFIGSNFVARFKERFPSVPIIGLDDFSSGRRDRVDPSVVLYEGSIVDEVLLETLFEKHKPEFVFHFAAMPRVSYSVEHPAETSTVNITGTVALLHASARHNVTRFIFSSSCAVCGNTVELPLSETAPCVPVSPYAVQKFSGEMFCRMFSESFGLDTVSLRYFNVFGPGQHGDSSYATVISAWLEAHFFPTKTKKGFLEGDGTQSRDFCYVEDVVEANILAMQASVPLKGDVFNISSGNRVTLNTVKNMLSCALGSPIDLDVRPPRQGDIFHMEGSGEKAKHHLGYTPNVSFDEGLRRTIEWFRTRVE